MNIIELRTDDHERYKTFFIKGLTAHADYFRISANDERQEPFPTKNKPDSFTLAAISGTADIAGIVSFKPEAENREKLQHKGLLMRMYVDSNYSGMGIGTLLIQELIDRVKKVPHIEKVNLTVAAHNAKAITLYKKFGFEIFSTERKAIKSVDGDYIDEFTMSLDLKL